MKKISRFDLGFILAFVIVALLGGGAWWYLSGQLQDAQAEDASANAAFVKYSTAASTKEKIVVSRSNGKTLQANIDLLKAQIDPLITVKFQPKENKLRSIEKEDPVAWKHDLDNEVHRLNAAAQLHGVTVPPNFYFSFSRYLNQNPSDAQTAVLSKQLVGLDQLATILIDARVKGIQAIRRTYEEDPHTSADNASGPTGAQDHLGGYARNAVGNAYTAYPFEIDFETTSENLRPIINNLIQSPYLFVIRSLSIQNSSPNSPSISGLADLAGLSAESMVGTAPGEVAAPPATNKGPQYLFGNSTLKIKARIDMIEWKADVSEATSSPAHDASRPNPSPHGGI